jgi:hypothetical protein
MKTRIIFGFVSQPLNRNGFGIAIVDDFVGRGKAKSFSLTAETGPHAIMEDGARKPKFAETLVKRLPAHTDGAVLEVYRGDDGLWHTKGWAFQSDWDATLATIKSAPRDHESISERFWAKYAKCEQAVASGLQKSVTAMTSGSQKPKPQVFKSFDALAGATLGR